MTVHTKRKTFVQPRMHHPLNNEHMAQSKDLIRKWIIIEDDPNRAKYLIAFILRMFKEDRIYWLYTNKKDKVPSFISEDRFFCPPPFRLNGVDDEEVCGEIDFRWCDTPDAFFKHFKEINDYSGIILLDVNMPAFGSKDTLDEDLSDALRGFLYRDQLQPSNAMVTIVSSAASYTRVIKQLSPHEKKVEKGGAGEWSFESSTFHKDCKSVIELSDRKWQELYGKPDFTLQDFLCKMAELDQHDCHNWRDEIPAELIRYKKKGRWDKDWDMPIQLAYLIKLLNFTDADQFVEELELKKPSGHFLDGSVVCECLKVMGTKAKPPAVFAGSLGTLSFSLLGATFVCWAAYRQCFKLEDQPSGDQLFMQAIKSLKSNPDKKNIARYKLISPPQQHDTLQRTITALYEMMMTMYTSTLESSSGEDLLKDVSLNKTGLAIRINISPKNLFAKLSVRYKNKIMDSGEKGDGDTCTKILQYFDLCNYCDNFGSSEQPFLGAFNSLKLYRAGDYDSNGIIVKIGNEA